MFIVKFYIYLESGAKKSISISCPHYDVDTDANGAIRVTTYPTVTDDDGDTRYIITKNHKDQIAKFDNRSVIEETCYNICYVENASGKTVDRLGGIIL